MCNLLVDFHETYDRFHIGFRQSYHHSRLDLYKEPWNRNRIEMTLALWINKQRKLLLIITAALLHLPLPHWSGQYSPLFFFRYSLLHDCSGSSLPSLQSKMELQNECSGTQVPSLHLKPLPGHSEMGKRYSLFTFMLLSRYIATMPYSFLTFAIFNLTSSFVWSISAVLNSIANKHARYAVGTARKRAGRTRTPTAIGFVWSIFTISMSVTS